VGKPNCGAAKTLGNSVQREMKNQAIALFSRDTVTGALQALRALAHGLKTGDQNNGVSEDRKRN
jgi:hypothetical protein